MKLSSTAIALSAVLALAGCDNSAVISPEQQMGPDRCCRRRKTS